MKPSLSIPAANAAQNATGQAPGFYRTKVGGIEVTSLLDGALSFDDALLGNAKDGELAAAKERNFLKSGQPFPGYISGFLIDTGSRKMLVDTGARGVSDKTGHILESLQSAGIAPDEIDDVIITHAHGDHIGGLLNAEGMRVFPKANIRISKPEMDFWFDAGKTNASDKLKSNGEAVRKILGAYRDAGQVKTFAFNADLNNGVSSVALPGHTPGHSGIRVSDGNDQLLIWADIVHVQTVQFADPGVSIAYDVDPALAAQTRRKIMDEAAADKFRIAGMHLSFPAIGHVAKAGQGFEFVPQMWEPQV